MFTLLKNAEIYAPAPLGPKDLLIAAGKIAAIEDRLEIRGLADLQEIDLAGAILVPGFIDGHVHLIGGGGEGGFSSRTPEVMLTQLTRAGITTVVGLLGTDRASRHNASLYAKTKALCQEGITARMFTGGYALPSPTVTGSVHDDIFFLDTVIGLKLAISDHRCSWPTLAELQRLVSDARMAAMVSGKCGRVVAHLGTGTSGLEPLRQVVETTEIPIDQFIPTHINRKEALFEQALLWAEQGGIIDITSGINPDLGARGAVKPSRAVARCVERGLDLQRVCISSDGNGSMPCFDDNGRLSGLTVTGFESLLLELQDMGNVEGLPLAQVLIPYTSAPAAALGLTADKGVIAVGKDADLLVLDNDLRLQHGFARGRMMVRDGQAIVKGTFE